MRRRGYSLGGEQSGHVILLDHATTGDGILTSMHLLARLAHSGKPMSELVSVMERLPQVLVNVRGVRKDAVADCAPLHRAVQQAEAEMGEAGRVLLRPSGTEPLVRVMVEAPTAEQAQRVADRLADVVRTELALT
jgi:phosphoglucosamine mutase